MRAVLMERGKLWVDEVPDPTPGPGEILVKSIACGICGSDLHAVKHTEDFVAASLESGGAFKLTTLNPIVLGHEFCAEVVDFGPKTEKRVRVGDLVCSVPALRRDEVILLGYSEHSPGGFAEYMLLSEALVQGVPVGTPADIAALTEPMAVGLHAVNKARLSGKEAVVVLGCGPVGLAVITALRARGAGPVIASDFSPGRRAFAERQGAHAVGDPSAEDIFEHPDLGRASDVVIFECVGVPGMLDRIFRSAPKGARVIVVGVCMKTDSFQPLVAINKELSLQFVLGYSMEEFQSCLEQIADGRFDVGALITGRVSLDGVQQAFLDLGDPERHAKVLVEPWATAGSRTKELA